MEIIEPIEILGVEIGKVREVQDDRTGRTRYYAHSKLSPMHISAWRHFDSARNQLIILAFRAGAFKITAQSVFVVDGMQKRGRFGG